MIHTFWTPCINDPSKLVEVVFANNAKILYSDLTTLREKLEVEKILAAQWALDIVDLQAIVKDLREKLAAFEKALADPHCVFEEENDRLRAKLAAAEKELTNIATAKRFDREKFDDDTSFADWAQNRARFTLDAARKGG